MATPPGWPPRPASGIRSIRFYKTGTSTAAFDGNAFLFADATSANTITPLPYVAPGSTAPVHVGTVDVTGSPMGGGQIPEDAAPPEHQDPPNTQQASPHPQVWSMGIRVQNLGAAGEVLEISFDGVNVHGSLTATAVVGETEVIYMRRHEAGIAVRGAGGATPDFVVEAW